MFSFLTNDSNPEKNTRGAPPGVFSRKVVVLILFFSVFLSSCGFHLKGTGEDLQASYKTVRLLDAQLLNRDVYHALKQQFNSMDVKIVDNMAGAELSIQFEKTQFKTSTTGRTGSGDVASELLKMSQFFRVSRVVTEQMVVQTTVTSFRDRSINSGLLQASSRELQSIKQQMSVDIALKIVSRINYAMKTTEQAKK